jgi:hypothetical protein
MQFTRRRGDAEKTGNPLRAPREHISTRSEPIEKTLRRVIREELRKKGVA